MSVEKNLCFKVLTLCPKKGDWSLVGCINSFEIKQRPKEKTALSKNTIYLKFLTCYIISGLFKFK